MTNDRNTGDAHRMSRRATGNVMKDNAVDIAAAETE